MKIIRSYLRRSKVFNFNCVERDVWVCEQASKIPTSSIILDVGAGSCPYREYFSHCDYKTQDFASLSPEQLRGRTGYGKIDYLCDATNIPVSESSFDAVLCTEVLEHVPEPIRVIYEFARIIKPGGKLLLTAPLGSGIHQEPYHFYGGYTPFWYQKFLTEAGFSEIFVQPNGGFFKHYSQESIRFVRMTVPWKMKTNFVFLILWSPIWLILFLWLAVVLPICCHWLDRLDHEQHFTIGYHVVATRNSAGNL